MRKPPVMWRPEWDALLGTMPTLGLARRLNVAQWTVIRHVAQAGVRRKKFVVACGDCGKPLKRKYMKKVLVCKKCKTKRNYQKCRLQKIAASRAWRRANKARAAAYFTAWRERNRAYIRRYNRRWNKKLDRLTEETLGDLPCLDCGLHHGDERRAAILRRMLPASVSEIRDAHPCIWGHPWDGGTAKERLLYRDLEVLGASHPPGTLAFSIRASA